MRSHNGLAHLVLLAFFLLPSCAPKPEPVLDQATVVARNASVRLKNSSTSRTLVTLNPGDKVEVLQRQDNWYRIKHGDRLQGWMEESTILTNETMARIRQMAVESQSEPPQNTATVKQDANLRIDPGRSTGIIKRLDNGTKFEILGRLTRPRPNSDGGVDVWLKVRSTPTEVGYLLASLVEYDVPSELSQYTEGYAYTTIKPINQVQDPIAGPVNWYVVGERAPGTDPVIDFSGIRVFTWNMKKHRYETAFREHGIRGVYPLEIGQEKGNPTFRYYALGDDNSTKTPHEFVMYGVVTRPLEAAGSAPSPRSAPRKARGSKRRL